ncbi:MAG: NusG domain II-containing protein [Pseudomonadota bacterium]
MNSHEAHRAFLRDLRPGDWLTLLAGTALLVLLTLKVWHADVADTVIIRSGGKVFDTLPLSRDREIAVPGPLGTSIVTIEKGRARISSDPSPRQYCVRQGWLQKSGEIAVCLPNEVSVELSGGAKKYDSLNY